MSETCLKEPKLINNIGDPNKIRAEKDRWQGPKQNRKIQLKIM